MRVIMVFVHYARLGGNMTIYDVDDVIECNESEVSGIMQKYWMKTQNTMPLPGATVILYRKPIDFSFIKQLADHNKEQGNK